MRQERLASTGNKSIQRGDSGLVISSAFRALFISAFSLADDDVIFYTLVAQCKLRVGEFLFFGVLIAFCHVDLSHRSSFGI